MRVFIVLIAALCCGSTLAVGSPTDATTTANTTATANGLFLAFALAYLSRRRKIGGWLLYYYVQLFLSVLMTCFITVTTVAKQIQPTEWDNASLYAWYVLSTVPILLVLVAQAVMAGVLLFRRNEVILGRLRFLQVSMVIASGATLGIDIMYFPETPNLVVDGLTLFFAVVWTWYFRRAKRVQKVFVEHGWDNVGLSTVEHVPTQTELRHLWRRAAIGAAVVPAKKNRDWQLKEIAVYVMSFGALLICLKLFFMTPNAKPELISSGSTANAVSLEKMSKDEREALTALLMQSAFGEKYDIKEKKARANLRDLEKRDERGPYELIAQEIYLLPDEQILLVANAQVVLDSGEVNDSHAAGGLLNLFWFRAGEKLGTWKLSNRAENIDSLGSFGVFGRTQISRFADKQSMLTIESGGTWQGYTAGYRSFFHVTNNAVHALGYISTYSGNLGACDENTEHCWEITADWKLLSAQPGTLPDLQLTISGVDENMPEKLASSAASRESSPPVARLSKKVEGNALYRVKDGKYVLIQGKNTVPKI